MRALYVCYFGLREPLVQTQVLPYLRQLADGGVEMALLTFEPDAKRSWTAASIAGTKARLQADGIAWHSLPYHKTPSLPSTLFDIAAGARRAAALARRNHIDIFHGRSHVGAVIAALARRAAGSGRVVFDIRGLLAEQYADAGRWSHGGPLFRIVKAAERRLCRTADGFVVLTARATEMLFPGGSARGQPVEVIPCCVDLERFAGAATSRAARRAELGVADRTVLVFVGSLGGACLARETAAFLTAARRADPRVYALIVTPSAATTIVEPLERGGFGPRDYAVIPASPDEVPGYLAAADAGLAILRPSYALRAASPTKFAEYLAAGLPVVASAGIGELDGQIELARAGVSIRSFDERTLSSSFAALEELRRDPRLGERCRELARTAYDLRTVGGVRYRRLYDAVMRRSTKRIRVLALASYPVQAASSRYRLVQFIQPLAERGIDVRFSPFLDTALFGALYDPRRLAWRLPHVAWRTVRRVAAALRAVRADVVVIQREAMLFGPPIAEWIVARLLRRPLILDLDDATYLSYPSPVYGRLAPLLKGRARTDTLIGWSRAVTCGNPTIAEYVRSRGGRAVVVPTVVDAERFRPDAGHHGTPRIGWIGTHGTYPFFERLLPVFARLARDVRFRLTVIGSGRRDIRIPGVDVDVRPWEMTREADDFRSLDIGVYPMPDDEWSAGKSGLKAVQYMMSGVASVISPVGVCATLGTPGETHLAAVDEESWTDALRRLVADAALRERIGRAGRTFAERHFSLDAQADALASVIRDAGP